MDNASTDAFAPPRADVEQPIDRTLAGPWRRWLARSIDMSWQLGLLSRATDFILDHGPASMQDVGTTLISAQSVTLTLVPIAMILDAATHGICGNTPGKAILGVRVLSATRERLSFRAHVRRNMHAWLSGWCLGLPLLSMATWIWQWIRLNQRKPASYDASSARRVECIPVGGARVFLAIVAYLVVGSVLAFIPSERSKRLGDKISRSFMPFQNRPR